MANHYSEIEFLFNYGGKSVDNPPSDQIGNIDNTIGIFDNITDKTYVVFKGNDNKGTQKIKNYINEKIYSKRTFENPYMNILDVFGPSSGSLYIRPSHIAYLRDLGVYPINRMIILRRYAEGTIIPDDLNELKSYPISTVIGWLKPDDKFGNIKFNETWTTIDKRIDEIFREMLSKDFGLSSNIIPIPGLSQGIIFKFFEEMGLVDGEYSVKKGVTDNSGSKGWNYNNVPFGDPDVLKEGPYRDPENQNIKSDFNFNFEVTYEQKMIGDVDPGSAMIDIIENLLTMGTSEMKVWFDKDSKLMNDLKSAVAEKGNNANAWWEAISSIVGSFLNVLKEFMKTVSAEFETFKKESDEGLKSGVSDLTKSPAVNFLIEAVSSIITMTLMKYRWHLRGSISMMTGESNTPWHLTIGNPFSPWISSNFIVVDSIDLESGNEVGFNDMPMSIKATVNCRFSRSLGKNEILKMFNHSFIRKYSYPIPESPSGDNFTVNGDSFVFDDEEYIDDIEVNTANVAKELQNIPPGVSVPLAPTGESSYTGNQDWLAGGGFGG